MPHITCDTALGFESGMHRRSTNWPKKMSAMDPTRLHPSITRTSATPEKSRNSNSTPEYETGPEIFGNKIG